MKKTLSIMAGIIGLCLSLTSCEDYVNRAHLYGNWDCYSGPDFGIAFNMKHEFDYLKRHWDETNCMIHDEHWGTYTCTDTTFTLHCTRDHYNQTEPCKPMTFHYVMTDEGMTLTDEQGNIYLMR